MIEIGGVCMVRLLTVLVAVVAGGCGGDDGTQLNCVAFCNFRNCLGETEPCQGETCSCAEGGFSDGFKALINMCGTENTCDRFGDCYFAGIVAAFPPRRALDEQVTNACGGYAVRCSLDSTTLCSQWTNDPSSDRSPSIYSDAYLGAVRDCYTDLNCSADATQACLDFGEQSTCGS